MVYVYNSVLHLLTIYCQIFVGCRRAAAFEDKDLCVSFNKPVVFINFKSRMH